MRSVIYGCDIFQIVCPYNQGIDFHLHEEMEPDYERVHPKLEPMLTISNKEFKEQFGQMAGSDRKSTRLNSSHVAISYAVFCLKKKKNNKTGIYILCIQ